VERGAVKSCQRPIIARKMRWHPIDKNADACVVQRVDEALKIIGRSVPAGGGIKTGYLIAPGRKVGVLGHRQEFHVREAKLLDVFDERLRDFTVAERLRRGLFPPGAEVNLVHADRSAHEILFTPSLNPCVISPLELAVVPHDRGVFGRWLEEEAVRI